MRPHTHTHREREREHTPTQTNTLTAIHSSHTPTITPTFIHLIKTQQLATHNACGSDLHVCHKALLDPPFRVCHLLHIFHLLLETPPRGSAVRHPPSKSNEYTHTHTHTHTMCETVRDTPTHTYTTKRDTMRDAYTQRERENHSWTRGAVTNRQGQGGSKSGATR